MRIAFLVSVLAMALALGASPLRAQAVSPFSGPGASSAPVEISADLFEITEADRQAVFSGNVIVTQDDFRLTSARVVVHYGPAGQTEIETLVSPGPTRIDYAGQTATGNQAQFEVAARVLKISGDVRVQNQTGTFTGPELVVDLARGTTAFGGGGGGRVTGVFTPGG